MIYKFKSRVLGLMIWKDGSIVATFVNGLFETTDLTLASYVVQFEEVRCLTPFEQEQPPDLPPDEPEPPVEPEPEIKPETITQVAPAKKVTKK
jgi:hypothetical protein